MKNQEQVRLNMQRAVIMLILAAILLIFNNVYQSFEDRNNMVTVFVAKNDLKLGNTAVLNDFVELKIPKTSLDEFFVTDFNEARGKTLNQTILKGDILYKNKLSERGVSIEGGFSLLLKPGSSSYIRNGDIIKVYAETTNRAGEIVFQPLFHMKQVVNVYGSNGADIGNTPIDGTPIGSVEVSATEQEVTDYYTVINSKGRVSVVKITDLNSLK